MEEKLVTILTPTYNRGYCIKNLYNSLLNQTKMDFKWIIVDDGSTDSTKEVIESIQEDGIISIEYLYKENGGKHTAVNVGVRCVDTKYVFIVDSDDVLTKDAVSNIFIADSEYKCVSDICGYSFLRKYPDERINGKLFKKDGLIDSYVNVRLYGKDSTSDKAEVFYTEILKKYPFPVFENEKFLGEDIVWVEMSKKYKMVHINKAIYVGDYQNDGLTKNRRKNNIKSCKGCYERSKAFLTVKLPLKIKIKNIVQLFVYGKFSNYDFKKMITDCKSFMGFFLYLPSLLIYKKWKSEYEKN